MEITVAKNAGFCFGVKHAVDTVYQEIGQANGPVYTYGPIIHNDEVVNELAAKGVRILADFDALKALPAQGDKPVSVIIRSHGAPRFVHDYIRERGFRLVDATCPFVGKIHRIVEEESKKGRKIIIIGNDKHPEVEGIKGWCTDTPVVIGSAEEAKAFTQGVKRDIPITVVAQTTFNLNKFQEIVEILEDYCYDDNTVNTICNATEARQKEAEELAGRMDAMLVVGGARSSNTQKLFEICSSKCKRTYFVQSAKELTEEDFSLVNRLGVTAGASTPNYIIEEIMDYVRVNFW